MLIDGYLTFKLIHIVAVICSITLFLIRALILIRTTHQPKSRWLKILPHLNDTLLLVSALLMLYVADIVPDSEHNWLTAKIIAMLLYILSGFYLFKLARSKRTQLITLFIALAFFSYIVHTALAKTPFIF